MNLDQILLTPEQEEQALTVVDLKNENAIVFYTNSVPLPGSFQGNASLGGAGPMGFYEKPQLKGFRDQYADSPPLPPPTKPEPLPTFEIPTFGPVNLPSPPQTPSPPINQPSPAQGIKDYINEMSQSRIMDFTPTALPFPNPIKSKPLIEYLLDNPLPNYSGFEVPTVPLPMGMEPVESKPLENILANLQTFRPIGNLPQGPAELHIHEGAGGTSHIKYPNTGTHDLLDSYGAALLDLTLDLGRVKKTIKFDYGDRRGRT